ncbi:MAG: Asp-tRNA(Asn)/Glu-tRNA(Gln) amidotransferase subunit GatB [Thermoprotei archaeon]
MGESAGSDAKIGLEVHVELNRLKTKLFCSCSTAHVADEPNTVVCPVCLGLPGSLPVLNSQAVFQAIAVALALECRINRRFNFVRKNYFYPDMTKNFQISQYSMAGGIPIAEEGKLVFWHKNSERTVRIRRIQIEEDPARLEHPFGLGASPYVLVDYNRAGMGLLEIVTEPDMSDPSEARDFVASLRSVLEHLNVSDTSREAAMRADANISVNGGERVEVKNVSSYKEIERALEYEKARQLNLLRNGGKVPRETRHWLETKGITIPSRAKEYDQDYRYMPEPDIPVVEVTEEMLESVKESMPELPSARVKRFVTQYGLSLYESRVLVLDKALADYFEETVSIYPTPKPVSNWIQAEVMRQLNERGIQAQELKFTPKHLADLLRMIDDGTISGKIGKKIVMESSETGETPLEVVRRMGLIRISDDNEILRLAKEVIDENPEAVSDAKKNPEALNFLVGQMMKKTRGRADPAKANSIIRDLISQT